MKVSALMNRDVAVCRPDDPMDLAAELLWQKDCGAVPVVDIEGRLQGMLTDRDLTMAAWSRGLPLRALRVRQAMSRGALCCTPDDEFETALAAMAKAQVRRLPVLDDRGRFVGLLTLADIIQHSGHLAGRPRRAQAEAILDALVEVTRPRRKAVLPRPAEAAEATVLESVAAT